MEQKNCQAQRLICSKGHMVKLLAQFHDVWNLGKPIKIPTKIKVDTLPETDGWKKILSFWETLFSVASCSFQAGFGKYPIMYQKNDMSQLVNTVDGSEIRRLPVQVGRLSHYVRRVLAPSPGFIHAGFQPWTVGVFSHQSPCPHLLNCGMGPGICWTPIFDERSSTWRTMMMKMMKVKIRWTVQKMFFKRQQMFDDICKVGRERFLFCNLKQLIWIQSNLYVETCHVRQEVHGSGQISLRVTHTTDFPQMVVIVREMGPLISGKSRLVKYYNLAR